MAGTGHFGAGSHLDGGRGRRRRAGAGHRPGGVAPAAGAARVRPAQRRLTGQRDVVHRRGCRIDVDGRLAFNLDGELTDPAAAGVHHRAGAPSGWWCRASGRARRARPRCPPGRGTRRRWRAWCGSGPWRWCAARHTRAQRPRSRRSTSSRLPLGAGSNVPASSGNTAPAAARALALLDLRAGHGAEVRPRVVQPQPRPDLRAGQDLRAAAAVHPRAHDPRRLPALDHAELAVAPRRAQLGAQRRGREAQAPAVLGRDAVVRVVLALQPRLRRRAHERVLHVLGPAARGREEVGHGGLAAVGQDLARGVAHGAVAGRASRRDAAVDLRARVGVLVEHAARSCSWTARRCAP